MLRRVLGQPAALSGWDVYDGGVTSRLARVECLRTIDRLRALRKLGDADAAARGADASRLLEALEQVAVDDVVLARAAQPVPTPLGTLDAVHLASALLWREARGEPLTVATHDAALALAAGAFGFEVIGV